MKKYLSPFRPRGSCIKSREKLNARPVITNYSNNFLKRILKGKMQINRNLSQDSKMRRYRQKVPKTRWTWGLFWKSAWKYLKIFFKNSSMHGLKYIVSEDNCRAQKIFWCAILIFCHVCCLLIGYQSIQRFMYKSTVMGIERDYYYWNTSLPSTTVCPMERIDSSLYQDFCRNQNITDDGERKEFFVFLESLANSTYMNFEDIQGSSKIDGVLQHLNLEPEMYMELIFNLTKDLSTSQSYIYSTDGKVELRIRLVLTEHGICYMTNSAVGLEYSAEFEVFGRYPKIVENQVADIKGSYFDRDIGYDFYGFSERGIISYLHSPHDVSRVNENPLFSTETMQYITSVMDVVTDENFFGDVSVRQRKCRFHNESNLAHFDLYTKNLCRQECRLNLALEKCGCIPHFYPNRGPNRKKVCHYRTLRKCFPKYEQTLLELSRFVDGKKEPIDCGCMQNCVNSIFADKKAKLMSNTRVFSGGEFGAQVLVRNWPTTRFRRQVVYTFTDLMISLGSTAGLFLGFTVLSFVEIIYFFTIRLFFHLRGIEI